MFNSLQAKILVLFIVIITCSTLIVMFIVSSKVKDAMVQAENKSAKNLLETVVLNVETQYNTTINNKHELLEDRKNHIKERVERALGLLEGYYELYQQHLLSEEDAQKIAINQLKKIRYDNGNGYIWINNTSLPYPRIIMHPTIPQLNGRLTNPDAMPEVSDNKNIFKDAVTICNKDGRGYIDYVWPKPDAGEDAAEKDKLSYVAIFKKWNWVVGSGIYIDDLEDAAHNCLKNALGELKSTLEQVRVAESGYVFVFTGDKEMLIHPKLEGVDFSQIKNPGKESLILDDLMEAAHSPEKSLDYIWDKPPKYTGEYRFLKRAFVSYFEPLDWYIASSVYNADIELPSQHLMQQILVMGIILLALASIAAYLLASHLTKPLQDLTNAAKRIQISGIHYATIPVSGSSETRELGAILGEMIESIQQADSEKENLLNDLEQTNNDLSKTNKKLYKEINDRKQAEKALRESEEKYKGIVENSIDTIMLTGPDGTISYLSPACKDVLGHDPETLRDTLIPISHPDDIHIANFIHSQFIEGKSGSNVEYRIMTARKDIKWISCSWSAIWEDNRIYMIISVIRDITVRKDMEDGLIKAHKMESLGVFAGGIAHDFNNLMMAILGNIAIAKIDSTPESSTMKNLENAENAIRRASKLSQQLLSFAAGETGTKKVTVLSVLIKDALKLAVKDSAIHVSYHLPDDLGQVDVDQHQIAQVFKSIVENAIHAMPRGGDITVRARNIFIDNELNMRMKQGEYVEIAVRDQGIGIAQEHISKIFDPYFTTKEKSAIKGTGLGLATAYSIIRQHGGSITVDSQVNHGTTFYIYLPVVKKITETKVRRNELIYGKGNILIVDDDDTARDILAKTLERLGYDVQCADNLEVAIEYYSNSFVRKIPFDVLIMSLSMPGEMDAKDVLTQLKKIDPKLKAIVTGGYENASEVANCQNYGCCGFLYKPVDVYSLSSTVHMALHENHR